MRNLSCLSFFFLLLFRSDGLYSIHINTPDNGPVTLSTYNGQKILVVPFNPNAGDLSQLQMLDAVRQDIPSANVVAVPAIEFSSTYNDSSQVVIPDSTILQLKTQLGISLVVTSAMYVQKRDSVWQHPLFNWLTHVGNNTHFDRDVEADGQLFFINEQGILYSIMPKGTTKDQIEQILNAQLIL